MRWKHVPAPHERVKKLSAQLGSSRILADLLLRIGIEDPAVARRFLRPRLKELEDPFQLTNLRAAAERVRRALESGERIIILGDYDVDGVTSTVLLVSILQRLGASPEFVVPRRLEEGYGLSRGAIDRALEKSIPGKSLMIAVDCGTNSVDEVAFLRENGLDVIVVDHHRSKEAIPTGCTLVNPHVCDEEIRAWTNLCTVGLVFKLVHGLLKLLRESGHREASDIILKEYLDLVALGTIADLVPLIDENRILTKSGLRVLQNRERLGLNALLDVCGVKPGEEVQPMDVSFRIGPRINASGRLADAALPVRMLLSRSKSFCKETARLLDEFNRERQDIERQIVLDAEQQKEKYFTDASGIVLFNENWHPGVVGIVASRVCRKYHRPAVILGSEGDSAKGSGRGVEGLNMVSILQKCDDLLDSWGGHPMAVGVSLPKENVEAFRRQFDQAVRELSDGKEIEPEIEIARWLQAHEINEHLLRELELLHPFGQGNPEPLFGVRSVALHRKPEVFRERHFRFYILHPRGRRLHGVAWKMADRQPPVGQPIDMIFRIYWNFFNHRKHLQIEMVDWRLASSPAEQTPQTDGHRRTVPSPGDNNSGNPPSPDRKAEPATAPNRSH